MSQSACNNISPKTKIYPGWYVVAAGFVMMLLMFGTRLSFGIYIKPMAESFDSTRASISGAQSLYMVVYAVFALISGSLSDRYGPKRILIWGSVLMGLGMLTAGRITSVWQYYMAYGVLVAIGSSALYVPVSGAVSKFFGKRRNFAIGITASGSGVGTFLIPPFMARIVEAEGWQVSFFYMGFILLLAGVSLPALFLRGRGLPQDMVKDRPDYANDLEQETYMALPASPKRDQSEKHYTLRQAMTTLPFWTYFGMYFILCFVIDGTLFVHIYPYLTDIGFSGQTAAKALGYLGLISTVTMVIFAPLGDRFNKRKLLTALLAIQMFMIFWLIHITSALSLWLFVMGYGILMGITWPLTVSILSDIFGSRSVGSILGACTLAFGLAGLTAPWMAGHIYDQFQSYHPVFYFSILLSTLSVVFTFFTRQTRNMT